MPCRRTVASLLVLSSLGFASVLAAELASASAGTYGSVPLAFEENRGQTDDSVSFVARGSGYGIFLAEGEIVFVLRDRDSGAANPKSASVVRLQFPGANPSPVTTGLDPLPGVSHYFHGNDPTQWTEDVAQFEKVLVRDLYPGIDVLFYGNQRQLEYDFIVRPGADLGRIRLRAVGGEARIETESGDLVVGSSRGALRQKLPDTFEEAVAGSGGPRRPVDARYRIDADGDIRFVVAEYRRDRTLIIDPVVLYSTYHGGADQDAGFGIVADTSGSAYVAGYTSSLNFPTQTPHQAANASNYTTDFFDAFVSKFNSAGSALLYSTYFGGAKDDLGIAIALDSANNVYVTGRTTSIDFPTTAGAYQMTNGGAAGVEDAFVFKLNPTGGLVYSTYIGGTASDRGEGIAVDAAGSAYISGITSSLATFPSTAVLGPAGAIDGFVFKLDPAGSARVYALRIGGSANDSTEAVNLDLSGNAYVAGHSSSVDFPVLAAVQPVKSGGIDATFYKVNAAGSALLYSTFLGGSGDDLSLGLQTDAAGNAYYTGKTNSPLVAATAQFPTSPGVFQSVNAGPPGSNDVFITKLTSAGAIAYSTLVGSPRDDIGYGIGVDSNGNATFAGETNAATGLEADVFISKINSTGTIQVYGIIFRGPANDFGRDLDFDAAGNAYVTGFSESPTPLVMFPSPPPSSLPFPARQPNNAGGADAIVIKFTDSVDLQVTKTDGQLTDTPGTSITYTIVVTNPGPSDAIGATVTDTFPAELSNVTWTAVLAGGATGATAGSGNISETVAIPVGGSITYTVTADISPSVTGTLTNTVTVAPEATVVDANPANNTATDTTLLVPVGDLAVTKTDGLVTATPGSAHQYTIVVTNNGPNAIAGATVTDSFPAAFTGVTFTATQTGGASGFTAAGAGNINDTVTMPAGSTITYIASGVISAAATGVLSNTVTVTAPAGTSDPVPANNTATDTTTLAPTADLAITKTDGVTTATPGGSVTYTIVVTNQGPSDVAGATVTDTFPAVVTATYTASGSAGTSGYTPAGSGNINDTVNLPAGGTITYIVTANISSAATGSLSNTATVVPPSGVIDGNLANNSSTDTDTLEPEVDLSITKSDSPDPVAPNAPIAYAIGVANSGQSDAVAVTLTDILPAGTTFASLVQNSGPPFSCVTPAPATAGTVTCTIATLGTGMTADFTLVVNVSGSAAGSTISNTATIASATADDNPANDSATTTTAVIGGPDVFAEKSVASDSQFQTGTEVTYTIVLTNAGGSTQPDNPGDEFTDILPMGVELVSASADSGVATVDLPTNTVHWNGALNPNQSVTVTITAIITATSGEVSNQGTAYYDADLDGINEASRLSDDASFTGDSDPTIFTIGVGPTVLEIPTLDEVALVLLGLLLAGAALIVLRRR
jgi:uncharacterized repeat protein (TIGR01451 family)